MLLDNLMFADKKTLIIMTLMVILSAIIIPVIVEANPRVIYVNKPHWKYCGYYKGHVIIINQVDYCDTEWTLTHEMRHYQYFRMHPKERIRYCRDNGMRYTRECWEYYANDF